MRSGPAFAGAVAEGHHPGGLGRLVGVGHGLDVGPGPGEAEGAPGGVGDGGEAAVDVGQRGGVAVEVALGDQPARGVEHQRLACLADHGVHARRRHVAHEGGRDPARGGVGGARAREGDAAPALLGEGHRRRPDGERHPVGEAPPEAQRPVGHGGARVVVVGASQRQGEAPARDHEVLEGVPEVPGGRRHRVGGSAALGAAGVLERPAGRPSQHLLGRDGGGARAPARRGLAALDGEGEREAGGVGEHAVVEHPHVDQPGGSSVAHSRSTVVVVFFSVTPDTNGCRSHCEGPVNRPEAELVTVPWMRTWPPLATQRVPRSLPSTSTALENRPSSAPPEQIVGSSAAAALGAVGGSSATVTAPATTAATRKARENEAFAECPCPGPRFSNRANYRLAAVVGSFGPRSRRNVVSGGRGFN